MAHILVIVEDHPNAIVFERVLTRLGGHTVTVTDDAELALELLREGEVDLLVLDVSLSNSFLDGLHADGLLLSRQLKSDPSTAHIPILLATAHAMCGDREAFLAQSQADEYLSKPIIDHRGFCRLVDRMLAQAGPVSMGDGCPKPGFLAAREATG